MNVTKPLKMASATIPQGVFAINKPTGISSAQVIRDCQHVFASSSMFAPLLQQDRNAHETERMRSHREWQRRGQNKRDARVKMGHGGTLDPLARGVLILGVGRGTKALQGFLHCTKTYEAVVLFGASTDTYDRAGCVLRRGDYAGVTRAAVEALLFAPNPPGERGNGFRGVYRQMPPLYSALKMEGKPLYEYAREGKPIPREMETREVEVSGLELVEWYGPGTHAHRWPAEEAEQAEKTLADSVWRVAKRQQAGEEAAEAVEAVKPAEGAEGAEGGAGADKKAPVATTHESAKRTLSEGADEAGQEESRRSKRQRRKLEKQSKREREVEKTKQEDGEGHVPGGSSSLSSLPPTGKGSNLVPAAADPSAPPPWEGEGPPAARIRLTVTSGFYVRSFCHDLGERLGCGAIMAELERSRQGQFVLGSDNCVEYDEVTKGGERVWGPRIEKALEAWNAANPGAAEAAARNTTGSGLKGEESELLPGKDGEKGVAIKNEEDKGVLVKDEEDRGIIVKAEPDDIATPPVPEPLSHSKVAAEAA